MNVAVPAESSVLVPKMLLPSRKTTDPVGTSDPAALAVMLSREGHGLAKE